MDQPSSYELDVVSCFPNDFFDKEVNEPFVQKVMACLSGKSDWRKGDPDAFEPDYFCGSIPFEITLASDHKSRDNFVQRLTRGHYTTPDAEEDAIRFIEERIQRKAEKHYSVPNVHLCVLCVIDLTNWVSDHYGSFLHDALDGRRQDFFSSLITQYINTGVFSRIFIVFPDFHAKWWVYDVVTGIRHYYQITDEEIRNGTEPFVLLKSEFDWIMRKGNDMIDAKKILQFQLAHGLGLDRYSEIMNGDPVSPDFQRAFNGFYRVRRNEAWRQHYYDLFVKAKAGQFTFEQIISELYGLTGNVEASFSSKMLATIDASKPIWDQYVLQNLGLELTGRTQEEKLRNAVTLYNRIVTWYSDYLSTDEAKKNIAEFDRMLPDYTWINDTKKIDCLLWSKRG